MGLLDDMLTGRINQRREMEREIARAVATGRVENFSTQGIQLRVPAVSGGRLGAATALKATTGMVDPQIFTRIQDPIMFADDGGATYDALKEAGVDENSSLEDVSKAVTSILGDVINPGGGNRQADIEGAGASRTNMVQGQMKGYLPADNTLANFMQLQSVIDQNMQQMNLLLNGPMY